MAVLKQIDLASNNGTKKNVLSGELASISKNGTISVNKHNLEIICNLYLDMNLSLTLTCQIKYLKKEDKIKFINGLRNANRNKNDQLN